MTTTTEHFGSASVNDRSLQALVGRFLGEVNSRPEMRPLCEDQQLQPALRLAAELAFRAFSPVHAIVAEIDTDPDTEEQRIVLDVTSDRSLDELLRQYATYTRGWVEAAASDAREKIRLCFHSLRDS